MRTMLQRPVSSDYSGKSRFKKQNIFFLLDFALVGLKRYYIPIFTVIVVVIEVKIGNRNILSIINVHVECRHKKERS